MYAVEMILALYVIIALLAYSAKKLKIPYPLLLVIGGLVLSRIPNLPAITIPPDYIFLVFLPPLLYHSALMTSWRDFRANARPITSLSVGLTLFTMIAIAVVARFAIPGFDWPSAFLLGSVISPTDSVAATAVATRMKIPKQIITVLEGESLVNDAVALVAYRFAIVATVTGSFSIMQATGQFVFISIAGIAFGLAIGWMASFVRVRLKEHSVEGIISLLTPFLAYVPAERMRLSGVLATVACGLYVGRRLSHDVSPAVRIRTYAVWDVLTFTLDGLLFILIGFALPEVLQQISHFTFNELMFDAVLISLVAVGTRLLWAFGDAYLPRKLFPKRAARTPAPSFAATAIIGWTAMRGMVSLAAALALPNISSRPLIIFLTFGAILATLLLQGLSLPAVIRTLGLKDTGADAHDEEVAARYLIALAAIERIDLMIAEMNAPEQITKRVRVEYDARLGHYSGHLAEPGRELGPVSDIDAMVRRAALGAERRMLVKLRDDGVIGDDIHRRIERELDLEESTLPS